MQHDSELLNYGDQEFMVDPDGYMFGRDQPPWVPDDLMGGGSIPPTFYLVKLSQEEDHEVSQELETFTDIELGFLEDECMDEKKDFSFVPWEKDQGGTETDMLRIAKETGLRNMIFIDRKSIEDKFVILAYTHNEYDKDENGRKIFDAKHQRTSGLDWGRSKGKEARLSWINLDIANLSIDKVVDGRELEFLSFDMLQPETNENVDENGYNFRASLRGLPRGKTRKRLGRCQRSQRLERYYD